MKLPILRQLLFFYCVLASMAGHASGKTITIVADQWCPFTCAEAESQQGIGVELIKKFFEARGYQVIYRTATWAEAIRLASEGEADLLIGTVKSETPNLLFPDYHFSYSQSCFFSPNDVGWNYAGLKSLHDKRVGIISDYSYGSGLDTYMKHALELGLAKAYLSTEQLFDALARGDIDVFINDQKVSEYHGRRHSVALDYRVSGCQPRRKLFFAVSPADPQKARKLIKILNKNLLIGLRGGSVKEVHQHYGFSSY